MPAIHESRAPNSPRSFSASPANTQSQWLFTEDELLLTPTILAGLSSTEERTNRAKGVNFILQVGILLKLPQITLSTASVFLHRFFMRYCMTIDRKDARAARGIQQFHYYSVAAAALWLAAKVEENCRKMKELVVACVRVALKQPDKVVDEQDKEFWKWRDTILALEDQLLEGLCFDLSLEPPYRILYDFMQDLGVAENKEFRNAAWAFINDSVLTPMCLLFPANVIAAASMYAAARNRDVKFETAAVHGDADKPWWTAMGVDIREIKRACNFMAAVYENAPGKNKMAEGMYSRTPEDSPLGADGKPRNGSTAANDREARETSMASAAGSDASKKRSRDEDGTQNSHTAAEEEDEMDLSWSGRSNDHGRQIKRTRIDGHAHPDVDADADADAPTGLDGTSSRPDSHSRSRPLHDTNGHGLGKSQVPVEAGPIATDSTPSAPKPEYNGPVSPDLGGSEEGELDE